MEQREPIVIVLEPHEEAALTAWKVSECFPAWREKRRRELVYLAERFRQRRRGWVWQEGQELCETLAFALDGGERMDRLGAAVDALANKASAITPASVEGFVATACRSGRRSRR